MKKYVLGIIGALIGGLIATLPWILLYVYGNMMFSALAIIIAWASLKGYRLLKGKEDKWLPLIITVVSILSVTIATLIIIPLILLYNEGFNASFYNLKLLYESKDFLWAILKDFVIAVVFTFLGISGTVRILKEQVKNAEKIETKEIEENK